MKAKPQKQITLPQIIEALNSNPLPDARQHLYQLQNAVLILSGTVLKVARRTGLKLHLQIKTEPLNRKMEAHAVFSDEREIEKVKELKIKKGSEVSISGKFQTCGESAVVLADCRLKAESSSVLARHKRRNQK